REKSRALVGADSFQHLEAVDLGQLQVEQRDARQDARVAAGVGAGGEKIIERLGAVARDHHFVLDVVFLERAQGQRFVVRIVFDQQNDFVVHKTSLPITA